MVRLRIHHTHLPDFLREVVTLVEFCLPNHTLLQFLLGDTGTEGQQFTTAIGTITVHHHLIDLLLIEGLTV